MATRGALLYAHNNGVTDYYSMAVYTAQRINHYLNLPVTVVTDSNSITNSTYQFDNTILVEPDRQNSRNKLTWINRGRYQSYDISPYDHTLLLDTDYMVNSQTLLKLFDLPTDFICHKNTKFIMEDREQERLSQWGPPTLWATVIRFSRTNRSKQIFDMMKMIQDNYQHYSNIYKFIESPYRNDYALTIALRTINGQMELQQDYIPWSLLHVTESVKIYRETETKYVAINSETHYGKSRNFYIKLSDCDFHMLSKTNFMELMQ